MLSAPENKEELMEIYIYGASGHGRVVMDSAKRAGYTIKGFIDDDKDKRELLGLTVLRLEEIEQKEIYVALGIGENSARYRVFNKLKSRNVNVISVIDPTAVVSYHSSIEEGSVIFANAVINNSASIGKGVIINTAAIVEHDCKIGNFSHISPNAALAGNVVVGEFTQVGIGASVKQGVTIGNNVMVGAGAVVVKDVPDNVVVAGVPARIIRENRQS